MNKRTEELLATLKEDKNYIESLIIHDIDKIEEHQKSLSSRRYELAQINELIRKLVKQ